MANRQAKAQLDHQIRHRINAGRVAVREQIAFFGRQFGEVSSEWKADDTRVTFADFAISEKIFAELRRDFREDDYCSEESNPQDEVLLLEARFAWVVDPIDGTNNYALGCSFCAISLALLCDGWPIYGFIYDHSTGALYEGGPGCGLMRNGKKVNRDAKVADAQTMIGLHFPMTEAQMMPLLELVGKYRVRCLGSAALMATYTATGYLSGVVDYKVKVWDIAAAYALCAAVGLRWQFIETTPFPLKRFHSQSGYLPYVVGTDSFLAELPF
ncbi:MAG: inositol monophosphatase [Puniceicoccaceae bacterium]|nr:MAG: inositol monophosphatase [Puniceicoccaceae bacterium]